MISLIDELIVLYEYNRVLKCIAFAFYLLTYPFLTIGIIKTKTSEGVSIDYLLITTLGSILFLSYTMFDYAILDRKDYFYIEDIIFGVNALFWSFLQLIQYMFNHKGKNVVNPLYL